MFTLLEPPLFTRLLEARSVLIAGAGGGFDVYAGMPLALALSGQGKQVHLVPSIVNGQIAAALRGEFGDVRFTARTGELFVNPLMAVYFAVDLAGLARSLHYLADLELTDHPAQISSVIERYREGVQHRPRRGIPH